MRRAFHQTAPTPFSGATWCCCWAPCSRCRPLRCIGNFHALSWPWRCWQCWPRSMPRCCRSRGGWLALLLAIPLVLVLFQRLRPGRLFRILAGILVALTLVTALNWEMVETRWHLMRHEVQVYGAQREADNSVGQRLEHWRYAWDAGREKPLTAGAWRAICKTKPVAWRQANTNRPSWNTSMHTTRCWMFCENGPGGWACC